MYICLNEAVLCVTLGRRMAGSEEALEEADAMCSERIVVLCAMHALFDNLVTSKWD